MIAIITVVIKNWLDTRAATKKQQNEEAIKLDDVGEMVYITEFIEKLRDEYEFDRVAISQFHNGGKFFNGRSMKKFSMTYEATAPGIARIKREYQNLLVSEFPKLFNILFEEDMVIVDTLCCDEYPMIAREMANQGIVQNIVIPIRGLRGDLIGFISCHNIGNSDDRITKELAHEFVDVANQLSGYLIAKQ
jgi:hypothetical protein